MAEAREVLKGCPNNCDSACHECLMHYWNQRVHGDLDRFAALDLLDWCQYSKLPDPLPYDRQADLLAPLNFLGSDYKIMSDGNRHYVQTHRTTREIVAYPAMWSEKSQRIPEGAVAVSDKLLKYALPKADSIIRAQL